MHVLTSAAFAQIRSSFTLQQVDSVLTVLETLPQAVSRFLFAPRVAGVDKWIPYDEDDDKGVTHLQPTHFYRISLDSTSAVSI